MVLHHACEAPEIGEPGGEVSICGGGHGCGSGPEVSAEGIHHAGQAVFLKQGSQCAIQFAVTKSGGIIHGVSILRGGASFLRSCAHSQSNP